MRKEETAQKMGVVYGLQHSLARFELHPALVIVANPQGFAKLNHSIQVDYFPYPVAKHNVFGRNRIHLMDKVTMYFEDYL